MKKIFFKNIPLKLCLVLIIIPVVAGAFLSGVLSWFGNGNQRMRVQTIAITNFAEELSVNKLVWSDGGIECWQGKYGNQIVLIRVPAKNANPSTNLFKEEKNIYDFFFSNIHNELQKIINRNIFYDDMVLSFINGPLFLNVKKNLSSIYDFVNSMISLLGTIHDNNYRCNRVSKYSVALAATDSHVFKFSFLFYIELFDLDEQNNIRKEDLKYVASFTETLVKNIIKHKQSGKDKKKRFLEQLEQFRVQIESLNRSNTGFFDYKALQDIFKHP